MLTARTNDGVDLCYETTGSGEPIIFVHEFAGHKESWEPQVRHFSRQYQVVTYNARGYPPSSVPTEVSSYSQNHAVADIITVMDHLKIERAHIVGLSMGGFATLHFGLQHPKRAVSLVVAGCGYGAELEQRDQFRKEAEASANVKAKLVSEGDSGGFAGIFKSLFDGINTAFTGPLATVYIAMAVLCCLCCLGLVIFLLSPGGQHATVVAANTGAKAAVL